MTAHDRLAIHEFVNRYWFTYDEGRLDELAGLLADDCRLRSRTELGTHPFEEFIRSDNQGRDAVMAWTKQHRRESPYPLRHHAANVHVVAERGDEVDVDSYLFVTQIVGRTPSTLSSGIVHWTLRRTDRGYELRDKEVVLDSIESAPFHEVPHVAHREASW
jgi:3-phenylpropionate/cinnamic acid dioxygenase small subunit